MGLFGSKKGNTLIDIIRCDEQEYLVHKWKPSDNDPFNNRENSIRYGSSLRVKDGEVAIFVYKQKDGTMHDFIIGPFDEMIKSANFPKLSNIVGSAFGGSSPFQAEIYFINLSGNIQIKFGIPYFDIFDPRFVDLGVPCAVRGTLTFNLTDFKNFIKLNRLINFDLYDFKMQIKDFFTRKVKSVVLNIPTESKIPVIQIESKIDEISNIIKSKLHDEINSDFGINLKRVDISAIELDKEHKHYQQLKRATADQQTKFIDAQTDINIKSLEETMRIQRKDIEMQVEGKNFAVHQLNQQTEVLNTAAAGLGEIGNIGNSGTINPAGVMTGIVMGGVLGNKMGSMLNNMNSTPPPLPTSAIYFIALNGKQEGSFTVEQLTQLIKTGQFTKAHYIWSTGMTSWDLATNLPQISQMFEANSPVPPPLSPI